MNKTNILLALIGIQFTALLVIDVIEIVKAPEPPAPVTSVCIKEDAKTTVCYCRR